MDRASETDEYALQPPSGSLMSVERPPETLGKSAPFRLRGATFHLVVLQISDPDPPAVIAELGRLLKQAPAFLGNAPIIVGLDALDVPAKDIDFDGLVAGLRGLDLMPIGVQGGRASVREAAARAGLPVLPTGATRGQDLTSDTLPETVAPQPAPPEASAPATTAEPASNANVQADDTKAVAPESADDGTGDDAVESVAAPQAAPKTVLVTKPVRAGRQVYANNGADLIVTSTVNPGAEIIADGHIHVYGALRGRAIAGATGNEAARIFATQFDPELVAIAGLYRVREDLEPDMIGESVQLSLDGDNLRVDYLVNRH